MFVVAIDPGGTTGWAVWSDPEGLVGSGQISGEDHRLSLQRFLVGMFAEHTEGVLVCEQFEQRSTPVKVDQRALPYIEWARIFAEERRIPFELQRPADVKSFWTDTKLKALGVYKPGKPHANDAARHALSYICRAHPDTRQSLLRRLRSIEERP